MNGAPPMQVHGSSSLRFRFGVAEMQGRRPYMEDRFMVNLDVFALGEVENPFHQGAPPLISRRGDYEKACLFGVFDGHGGSVTSSYLSSNFARALSESPHFPTSPTQALHDTCQILDTYLVHTQARDVYMDGSTGVVALLLNRDLWVANVGDSRAVLCRDGLAFPMSRDHKPDAPEERQRIEALGGMIKRGFFLNCELGPYRVYTDNGVAGGLAVSRAFGDFFYKVDGDRARHLVSSIPDVVHTTLVPGEDTFLLLASDGFWDVYSNDEACLETGTLLGQGALPSSVAKILASRATERRSMDNITVVIVVFDI